MAQNRKHHDGIDHAAFVFRPRSGGRLSDFPTDSGGPFADEQEARERMREDAAELAKHQDILMAHETHGLLVLLQGMDAGGKDEAIRHVLSATNPQGCRAEAFKEPTAEEEAHGFLWRAMGAAPARGRIVVFNRSYYEQVVTERVHPGRLDRRGLPAGMAGDRIWEARFRQINDFERYLTENNLHVLKFFLHVSREEQRRRLLERIDRPDKRWMFAPSDVEERAHWGAYMDAYEDAFRHTSTGRAPWHVIPADRRWFGRAAVASVILATLKSLHRGGYPRPAAAEREQMERARAQLEAEKPGK
jgi:PPK2 family polyphosphate:nucleotide phosphotransferase